MVGRLCIASVPFDVKGQSFVPPPDVDASVVCMKNRPQPIGEEGTSTAYFALTTDSASRSTRVRVASGIWPEKKDLEKFCEVSVYVVRKSILLELLELKVHLF